MLTMIPFRGKALVEQIHVATVSGGDGAELTEAQASVKCKRVGIRRHGVDLAAETVGAAAQCVALQRTVEAPPDASAPRRAENHDLIDVDERLRDQRPEC